MATLNISNITQNGMSWYVSGLSNYWKLSNYAKLVISTGTTTDGTTIAPSGIIDTVFPGSTGTSYSTPTKTVTSLSSNTTYTLYAYANTGTNYWFADSATFTTSAPAVPNPPSGNASAGIQSVIIDFSRGSDSNLVEGYISPFYQTSSASSGTFTFSGLNAGQSYYPHIRSRGNNGVYSDWVALGTIVPLAPPSVPGSPSLTVVPSYTKVDVTVNFGANTTYVNLIICPDGSTTQIGSTQVVSSSGGTVSFTGLTANTNYDILYRPYNATLSGTQEKRDTKTLNFAAFNWGITISSGSSVSLSASKWMELQNGINIKRVGKGLSAYSFTGASYVSTGLPIYAWLANQFISSMSTIAVGLPSTVNSGDSISANWLNQLTNSYNNII